jgi:hypothetical protein
MKLCVENLQKFIYGRAQRQKMHYGGGANPSFSPAVGFSKICKFTFMS